AVRLRRRIHRHPELGLLLPRTQEAVLGALEGLGYAIATGQACSSVVATLEGVHRGPTVLLRGDMDALPMREETGLAFASEADAPRIEVRGRGGHASAPHLALDPVPVAFEVGLAQQAMVTRRVSVFDPAVVTIAHVEAGTTNNVIPERAFMEGTVRALSDETRRTVLQNVRRVVEHVAGAHGLAAELTVEEGYP